MKIKRLFIIDKNNPSQQKGLFWEDEYGTWLVGETNSPKAFLDGLMGSPGQLLDVNYDHPIRHPELVWVTVYADSTTESEPSKQMETIVDPVIIEAYRRWNTGYYNDLKDGDEVTPLPVPGLWTQTGPESFQRIRDM
jgi:hypothetical protein